MSFKPAYSYISASDFAKEWREQKSTPSKSAWTIIDVRDDDFEGGHIKGCKNIPSNEFSEKVEKLVLDLQDAKSVLFHCSLSQARGPKAARIYKETREEFIQTGKIENKQEQNVAVLREGFSNFGSLYKNEADLVEDYDEESWKYR
jgi:rhodanese-related sulfurtransferase